LRGIGFQQRVLAYKIVNFTYDNSGDLLVRTDARGVSTHLSYDELNRVSRRWYNGSSATTDTINNSPVLPSGVGASSEADFFYDSQSLPGGAPNFSRGYSTGRLVAVTYGGSASSAGDYLGYDALGREVLKIQQTGSTNYQTTATYSVSAALISETYPSGRTVDYGYDEAGRTSSFSGKLGDGITRTYSTGIVYSSLGGMTKEQFGTDTAIYNKLFYNVRGQLSEIREGTSYSGPNDTGWERGAIINHYSDTCWGMCGGSNSTTTMPDNNGNLKKQEVYIPANDQISSYATWWQRYDYDSLNRLQRVAEITGNAQSDWQQEYVYDRWGNRTIQQTNTWGAGIPKPNFTVDTYTNRLTAPNGYTMSYDAVGYLKDDNYSGRRHPKSQRVNSKLAIETASSD
jgi:YD repeat-containing protein